ncbi:MAG: cupin domain-containing protein [Pyrinomonadaceae bacterium]
MLDLSHIQWHATRHRGVHLHVLRRDEATGDTTALIRMESGCAYPAHRHLGVEEVFILQGGYRDGAGVHRAGDYVLNEADSTHHPIALDDSREDCIMLAVAHGGIEIHRE